MSMTVSAASTAAPISATDDVAARFFVQGAADPGLLPRLLEPFAKLGTVPCRMHASREAGDGTTLTVDLRIAGVSSRQAELIEAGLRRVLGVAQLIAVVEPAA